MVNAERMDIAWHEIWKLLEVCEGRNFKYKTLPSLMLSVLVVMHNKCYYRTAVQHDAKN